MNDLPIIVNDDIPSHTIHDEGTYTEKEMCQLGYTASGCGLYNSVNSDQYSLVKYDADQ